MTFYSNKTRLRWAGAVAVALVAGYLDGYGVLFLKVYVSFMSGNTTSAGVMSGDGNFHAAFGPALSVLSFVSGSFCGTLLNQSGLPHAPRINLVLITGLLAAVAMLECTGLRVVLLEVALLALSMGMVNPTLTKVGAEPVSLTFVTGTLSRIGGHLASAAQRKPAPEPEDARDSQLRRAAICASIWLGFIGGAALSSVLAPGLRGWALLPPCAMMLALTLLSEQRAPAATKGTTTGTPGAARALPKSG